MKGILASLTVAAALLWGWVFFGDAESPPPKFAKKVSEQAAPPEVEQPDDEPVILSDEEVIDQLRRCATGEDRCDDEGNPIKPRRKSKRAAGKRFRPELAPSAPARQADLIDVDPGMFRVVLGLATMEGICAQGKREACALLEKEESAGIKRLVQTRQRLGKACDLHAYRACYMRGELDFAGGRIDGASRWYNKGKKLAMTAGSRCSAKPAKGKRLLPETDCAQIEETIGHIGRREREIKSLREKAR